MTFAVSPAFVRPTTKRLSPYYARSIRFQSNSASNFEYGRITTLPTNFGAAEFTFTIDLKLTTATASDFADDTAAQRTDWTTRNTAKYSSAPWWFRGNFCLDGHNNQSSNFSAGTLSMQFTNTGRPRWTFGDGAAAAARTGSLHGVQDDSAPTLRDSAWHRCALVRRFDGGTGSILESWIDGVMYATETSTARTNMWSSYWQTWSGFPAAQTGWFFGSEKQAAVGSLTQWEAYMGLVSHPAWFSRALITAELQDWQSPYPDSMNGLLDVIRFREGSGSTATGVNGTTMNLINGASGQAVLWDTDGPF
jgi:hypothetical protein